MDKKNIIFLFVILLICTFVFLSIKFITHLTKPKATVAGIQADKITSISFVRSAEFGGDLNFIKESDKWKVYASSPTVYFCEESNIKELMAALDGFKLMEIMTENKNNWNKFCVDESSGVTVKYYYENSASPAGAFVVGKKLGYSVDYCYFRYIDKPEVWLSWGLKKYMFEKDVEYWRNRTLLSVDKNMLEEIEVIYPAAAAKFIKKDGAWYSEGKKIETKEGYGFDLFLYNICDFKGDGILPKKESFGKIDFRIRLKAKDSTVSEVVFGFVKEENMVPVRRKDGYDNTPLYIYEYKTSRYRKTAADFLK